MENKVGRAVIIAVPTIVIIIVTLFALSFLISALLDLPLFLGLAPPARIVGGAIVLAGFAMASWVFRYRSSADMVVSTYFTLMKLIRRTPITEFSGRTEKLVVGGPQKYVRHPLYFGVILMVFGWALASEYTFVLVAGVAVLLWFSLVMIPFEERELRALFGGQYARYMDEVPMLVPFTRRGGRSDSVQGGTEATP